MWNYINTQLFLTLLPAFYPNVPVYRKRYKKQYVECMIYSRIFRINRLIKRTYIVLEKQMKRPEPDPPKLITKKVYHKVTKPQR